MEHHIKRLRSYDPEKKEKIIFGVTSIFSVFLLAIMVLLTGHRLSSFKEDVKDSAEVKVIESFSASVLKGTENED